MTSRKTLYFYNSVNGSLAFFFRSLKLNGRYHAELVFVACSIPFNVAAYHGTYSSVLGGNSGQHRFWNGGLILPSIPGTGDWDGRVPQTPAQGGAQGGGGLQQ